MAGLATWSGHGGGAFIVGAWGIPSAHRVFARRRAVVTSRATRTHVVLGFSAAAMAIVHTIAAIPELGSSAVIRAGMIALVPACIAFFLLFAHVGVGLRLRHPALRKRPKVRRLHVVLALSIVTTVTVHVVALLVSS